MSTDGTMTIACGQANAHAMCEQPWCSCPCHLTADQQEIAALKAQRDALREALKGVSSHLEHMIRYRHRQAHNGDIYQGGDFKHCGLCEGPRAALETAAAALASLPADTEGQ